MDNSKQFHSGQLVWVSRRKLRKEAFHFNSHHSPRNKCDVPWPARIADPPPDSSTRSLSRRKYWVYFFGYKYFSWVSKCRVEEFTSRWDYSKTITNIMYKRAVAAAKRFKEGLAEMGSDDSGSSEEEVEMAFPSNSADAPRPTRRTLFPDEDLSSNSSNEGSRAVVPRSRRVFSHPTSNCSPDHNNYASFISRTPVIGGFPIGEVRHYLKVRSATKIIVKPTIPPPNSNPDSFYLRLRIPSYVCGVVGCDAVGIHVAASLLHLNQVVQVHDSSRKKCAPLERNGAIYVSNPLELYSNCDVTFCCLTSLDLAKRMLFSSTQGVYPHVKHGKGVVILTAMDFQSSMDIAEIFERSGGKYLEAPIFYPALQSTLAVDNLFIMTAGHYELFNDLKHHLYAISPHTSFIGPAGNATKLCIILNSFMGTIISSLSEIILLGAEVKLFKNSECIADFIEIIRAYPVTGNFISIQPSDIELMLNRTWPIKMSIGHVQSAMDSVVSLAHSVGEALPVITAANESLKMNWVPSEKQ